MLVVVRIVVLVLLVGGLQVTLAQAWAPLGLIDGLMIVVGLLALRLVYPAALTVAAFSGLVQDGLGGGILGVHAFSKTAVAAVLNSMGSVLVVRGQLAEAVVFGVATVADGTIARMLLVFLDWAPQEPFSAVLLRGAGTGIVAAAYLLGRPWAVMRWQRWRRRPRRLL
jgi:hypothetical protein